jgi:hypothetical protein
MSSVRRSGLTERDQTNEKGPATPIAAGKELTVEESYRDALGCPAS